MNLVRQLLILMLLIPVAVAAQLSQMEIAGAPEKITTPIPEVRDINGRICAAIHVVAEVEGFKYDSYQGVVKVIDLKGLDIIFLSPDERVLEIYLSGYQPLKIILSDIGISLTSQQGWKISLTAEAIISQLPVVINSYPDSVSVTIDGIDYGVAKLFMLSKGVHSIQLSKSGFVSLTDSIDVDQNNSQFKFVLAPAMEMVFVKGGSFQMGDSFGDGGDDEKQVHKVTVSDFYISKYEVTFAEYDAFCEESGKAKPGDWGWGRGERPVINVSWYDAVEFCNWLSRKQGFSPAYRIDKRVVTRQVNANGYRLPSEAEWEYACRGGSRSAHYKYSGSNDVDDVAWYYSNAGGQTHPVGTKQPNELRLYDMGGNVSEWCADWYDRNYYHNSPAKDPQGPNNGTRRVLRGGSWVDEPFVVRAALRDLNYPALRNIYVGFRCARTF